MSDSDIKIKATLDTSGLGADLEKVGRDVDTSLDKAATSADKLSRSLGKVEESAKLSAEQIKGITLSLSGMALQVGGAYLQSRGNDTAAGYLKSAGSMAMQGAAALSPLGPAAAAIGAGVGAGAGLGMEYFGQQTRARQEEERIAAVGAGNAEAIKEYDRLRAAGDESAAFFRRLGDETVAAAETQRQLSERMVEFRAQADDLRAALGRDEIQRDAKQFGDALREYNRVTQEISKMTAAQDTLKTGAALPKDGIIDPRGDTQVSSLARLGIGAGGDGLSALANIQREGNGYLKSIDTAIAAMADKLVTQIVWS